MYRHSRDVVATHLDFACVDADTHLDTERTNGVESVADGVDFAASEPFELVADDIVVVVEQDVPPVVAERGGALGGTDDVGENDCGEYALGVEAAPHAGDELFELVEHRCCFADPVK